MFDQLNKRDHSRPQQIHSSHGCKVFLASNSRFKTNTISFNIISPLKKETVTQNALMASVLRQGCQSFNTSKDIAIELENCYGGMLEPYVDKQGDNQICGFFCSYPADEYAGERVTNRITKLMLSLVFDPMVQDGAFNKIYVDQEKLNLQSRIEGRKDDKMFYAIERCAEVMFEGEPYGLSEYGEIDILKDIDAGILFNQYYQCLKNSQLVVYLSGRFDIQAQEEFVAGLEKYLVNSDTRNTSFESSIKLENNEVKRFTEKMDVSQGKLTIGFTTSISANMEDYAAMMIANSVFGGGMHSKLFTVVREKESLAYYASSKMDKFKGIILASAGIEMINREKTEALIFQELKAVQQGEISEFELDASKKSIINMLKSIKDSQRTMQIFYLGQILCNSEETIETLVAKIEEVTKEQVIAAAQKIKPHTVYFLAGKAEVSE